MRAATIAWRSRALCAVTSRSPTSTGSRRAAPCEIVAASEALLRENLRVNESLFDNGKITEDQVLRAKAELLDVEQQKREVENLATQAHSFFNFLLNRDLLAADRVVRAAPVRHRRRKPRSSNCGPRRSIAVPKSRTSSSCARPAKNRFESHANRSGRRCRSGVDAGTQGEDYRFGDGYNFGTASLVFTWRLFDGGGDAGTRARRRAQPNASSCCDRKKSRSRSASKCSRRSIACITARDSLATAAARADAARAAFRIASRKRDEGVISQVEFIDARSTLTSAELNHNLTRFDVLARRAELEYATSTGEIPLDPGV